MAISQKPINLINLFSFTTITATATATATMSSPSFTSSPRSSSSSDSIMEETIKHTEAIIHKWNINSHSYSIFHENSREAAVFINCIRQLHSAMLFLASTGSNSEKLSIAQKLMQIAMKRLEKELYLILLDKHQHSEPEQQQPSVISISNLRLIADAMISCGYGKECIKVYTIIRKSAIDEALFHLGIQPFRCSDIKKTENTTLHFNNLVKIWSNAVPIAVKTLFRNEKFLCEHVFASHAAIGDLCFEKSTKDAALNMLMFPELIATRCKKLKPETIFIIMDVYGSISDLWPEIESIFSNESVSSVKVQARSSLHQLSNSVKTSIGELETSIKRNSSKRTVSGGGIHPLNSSVMTYLSSLADYGKENSLFLKSYLDHLNTEETEASHQTFSVTFECIILVLLCKLDGKSKFHNYAALSYLFLANNLHFIIEKVRVTNLKCILGEEWITVHEHKLKKYVSSYQTMSWNKVISCLPENPKVEPEKVRDCFRRLCSAFEEVYGNQTSWIVVDEKMRDKMKASIAKKLVPAYGEFYVKHLMTLSEDERCVKMLTRLSPRNMAEYLSGLFPVTSVVLRSPALTLPALSVPV